ncbi:BTB/POZ and MATH domain-containing protein 5-like [Panicum virgatum]|uniref:BTB/POZ and MATH domain-containing protein 5-like n=1 Tax=Panicum virgatum TaxID=38727 RepID=UPI0019D65141|nr:BTB/POZ and MATH domain-containing protein 5-like [Panicum virgatum]
MAHIGSRAPLLSAAVRQVSRSASPVRGFQVFLIDGYSWTKTLPVGVGISSEHFDVGGRNWRIDYYPNGKHRAGDDSDSDSISLYLQLAATYKQKETVRAHYKFSLLDPSGNAAYELPAATSVFTCARGPYDPPSGDETAEDIGAGLPDFITKEELERRRETLLRDDCLAIRCDVGVTQLGVLTVAPKETHNARCVSDSILSKIRSIMQNYGT